MVHSQHIDLSAAFKIQLPNLFDACASTSWKVVNNVSKCGFDIKHLFQMATFILNQKSLYL